MLQLLVTFKEIFFLTYLLVKKVICYSYSYILKVKHYLFITFAISE